MQGHIETVRVKFLETEQGQVLNYQSISARFPDSLSKEESLLQFLIIQYGVESHIDPCPIAVGIVTEGLHILKTVPGSLPCAESRSRKINGIGTAVYGRDADFKISCRCKEFQCPHNYLLNAAI